MSVEKSFSGFPHLKYQVVDPATYPYGQGTFDDPEPIMPLWTEIKQGDVVIDIGAAFGCYTLAALAMGARVHAFEPSTDGYRILLENVRLNGWEDRCTVHKTALYNGLGYPEALEKEVMGFHYVASDAYEDGVLDDSMLCCVKLIKIDVEGAELGVLQGGFGTILRSRPTLLIEDHDSDVDRWEVCRFPRSIRSSARIQALLDSLDYAVEVVPSAADRRYNRREAEVIYLVVYALIGVIWSSGVGAVRLLFDAEHFGPFRRALVWLPMTAILWPWSMSVSFRNIWDGARGNEGTPIEWVTWGQLATIAALLLMFFLAVHR